MTSALTLPLLAKELRERANRPRTYLVRVFAAVLLFGIFVWKCGHSLMAAEAGGVGGGLEVVVPVLTLQLVGVHLFTPALLCGAIAAERESKTLDVLRLTRLSPWRIVLEKFFAGLLPVATFILLGVPLYAVAYALGGVDPEAIGCIAWILALSLFEVGAFSLLMSACWPTPISAFVATYLVGAVLCWSVPEVADIVGQCLPGTTPWLLEHHRLQVFTVSGMWIDIEREGSPEWLTFAIWSVPTCVAILASLAGARFFLTRPCISLRRLWLLLRSFAGGTNSKAPSWHSLGEQPVLWRHCRGTLLAHPRRLLAAGTGLVFLGVAFWTLFPVTEYSRLFGGNLNQFDAVTVLCGGIAALLFLVEGTSAFAAERAQQTLDVLLTTPVRSSRIVLEKAGALWRRATLILPLIGTLLLISALEDSLHLWRAGGEFSFNRGAGFSFLAAVLTIVCYAFATLWLCLWLGLRFRKRRIALLTGLGVLCLLGAFPLLLSDTPRWIDWNQGSWWWHTFLWIVSPAHFQVARQSGELAQVWATEGIGFIAAHFVWISGLGYVFRRNSLDRADKYLGRPVS